MQFIDGLTLVRVLPCAVVMNRFAPVFLSTIASLTLACSSSSSSSTPPCNENPWECAPSQTCWPTSQNTFACLNQGPGKTGSQCQDSPGTPTCGEGLACLQTSASTGVCTPYCDNTDPNHACPTGQTCQTAFLLGGSGPEFHVCFGGTPSDAGSGDGAAPGSDSGAVGTPDAALLGADGSVPPRCTAWANHDVQQCPTEAPAATIDDCLQGEALYPPEGCGTEWERRTLPASRARPIRATTARPAATRSRTAISRASRSSPRPPAAADSAPLPTRCAAPAQP